MTSRRGPVLARSVRSCSGVRLTSKAVPSYAHSGQFCRHKLSLIPLGHDILLLGTFLSNLRLLDLLHLANLGIRGFPNLGIRGFPNLGIRGFPNLGIRGFPNLGIRGFPDPCAVLVSASANRIRFRSLLRLLIGLASFGISKLNQ